MKVGFIGLGNVGGKLAKSLLRNKFDLTVRDLDNNLNDSFADLGAKVASSPKELAEQVDLIITCLPSLQTCAEVMEAEDGVINGLSENKVWLEMSTTDESEVKRLGQKVSTKKAIPLETSDGEDLGTIKVNIIPKDLNIENNLLLKKDVKKYLDAMKKEFPKIQKNLLEY